MSPVVRLRAHRSSPQVGTESEPGVRNMASKGFWSQRRDGAQKRRRVVSSLETLEARTLMATTNAIVSENALPGNAPSEWGLAVQSSTIQGFATDISVNRGGTVNFKIQTDATAYHLDIYRMGYYAGNGARRVATVAPLSSLTLPQAQPAPLTDPATGLIDCGDWAVSASWAVPATATS